MVVRILSKVSCIRSPILFHFCTSSKTDYKVTINEWSYVHNKKKMSFAVFYFINLFSFVHTFFGPSNDTATIILFLSLFFHFWSLFNFSKAQIICLNKKTFQNVFLSNFTKWIQFNVSTKNVCIEYKTKKRVISGITIQMNPEGRRKKTTLKANPIYYHDLNTESQIYIWWYPFIYKITWKN